MAEDVYVKVKRSDAEAIRTALQTKTGGGGSMTAPAVAAAIAELSNISAAVVGTKLVLSGPVSVNDGVLSI